MEQSTATALLVMDMQVPLLSSMPNSENVIRNVAAAIKKARDTNISVIYVVVGFRKGAPEIGIYNKTFAESKARFENIDPAQFTEIHPAVAPIEDEVTVTKRRYSAFTGSDLEVILRAQNIRHLVLTGVVTSGVVLSTLREAADKDYRLTVLSDCCADRDDEVHNILIKKIFPRQADVMMVGEWNK